MPCPTPSPPLRPSRCGLTRHFLADRVRAYVTGALGGSTSLSTNRLSSAGWCGRPRPHGSRSLRDAGLLLDRIARCCCALMIPASLILDRMAGWQSPSINSKSTLFQLMHRCLRIFERRISPNETCAITCQAGLRPVTMRSSSLKTRASPLLRTGRVVKSAPRQSAADQTRPAAGSAGALTKL